MAGERSMGKKIDLCNTLNNKECKLKIKTKHLICSVRTLLKKENEEVEEEQIGLAVRGRRDLV